ncbi:MAG TPA: glycosyltransferase family 9 protein [Chthonomonadaceae bacterium]|nr:glycosyltransferase family 9 protein [Chthonomonadaceae bacterium]
MIAVPPHDLAVIQSQTLDEGISYLRLATELRRKGLLAESENAISLALEHIPDHLEALLLLAYVLAKQGRQEEADTVIRRAVTHPTAPLGESLMVAAVDLVELLRRQGRSEQADAVMEKIVGLEPENLVMHRQFGMLLLQSGEFKYGWREHSKRVSHLPQPLWDGGSLAGKTILVQAHQGFGDTIQFVRFLPLLKAQGARVLLEHQPALHTLLQGAEGWDALIPRHTGWEVMEWNFDLHIPLMSLPCPLETEAHLPASVPYLRPDPARVHHWRARLAADPGLKVGLVWAGNPDYKKDKVRSCRLADYAWLAQLPQVQFYSLQKGQAAEQGRSAPKRMRLIDLGPELNDFADTAAAIMNLDLVISVDTAVAHLSGALGRPTWTLLPFHACWRWLQEREDSPWYPTMRLFRQSFPGDWASILQRLIRELDRFSARS